MVTAEEEVVVTIEEETIMVTQIALELITPEEEVVHIQDQNQIEERDQIVET